MTRSILQLSLVAVLMATAACGGKKAKAAASPEEAVAAAKANSDGIAADGKLDPAEYEKSGLLQKPPPEGQGTFGYNEPLETMWHNGVGLRAVSQDRAIAISVHNRSGAPVQLYPHQFRLLLPDRTLYQFIGDRNDLLWFPERPIPHGGREVFVVSVPDLPQLVGLPVVFQYPPRNVRVKTMVEPTVIPAPPR